MHHRVSGLPETVKATVSQLSPEALEKLDSDGSDNTTFTRSTASIAMSWYRVGGTEESFIEVVSASHLGQTYPHRRRLTRELVRAYAYAEKKYDPTFSMGSLREQLEQVVYELWISELPAGLRETAIALVVRAHQVNQRDIATSSRVLAEISGYRRGSVSEHMKKLEEIGLVTGVRFNGFGRSRTFSIDTGFQAGEVERYRPVTVHPGIVTGQLFSTFTHKLWHRLVLGQVARDLYLAAYEAPASVADLCKVAGVSRPTVKKHLAPLLEQGLLIEQGGKRKKYSADPGVGLDTVAADLGADEILEEQQRMHDQDREEDREARSEKVEQYLNRGLLYDPYTMYPESKINDPSWPVYIPKPVIRSGSMQYRSSMSWFRLNEAGIEEVRSTGRYWSADFLIPEEYREPVVSEIDPWAVDREPTPALGKTIMDYIGEPDF